MTRDEAPRYCNRNICLKNEYNGIGCAECEVTKSREQEPVFYPQVEGITPMVIRPNYPQVEGSVPEYKFPEPCDDVISRRAVLKLFATHDGKYLFEAIRDLPSVTPKQTEITLESAIDYLHSIGWLQKHDKELTESVPTVTEFADKCRECGKQRTGHWIETAEEYYKAVNEYGGGVNEDTPYFVDDIACSECLAKYSVIDNETERFDHCPSCGAKMIDPQESEEQA